MDINVGDKVETYQLSGLPVGTVVLGSTNGAPRVIADPKTNDSFCFTDKQGWGTFEKFEVVYVPPPVVVPQKDLASRLKGRWFDNDDDVDPGENWRRVAKYVEENFTPKDPTIQHPLTIVDLDGDTWSRVPQNIDLYYFTTDDGDVIHETRDGIQREFGIKKEY